MDVAAYEELGLKAPAQRRSPPVGPKDVASILDAAVLGAPLAEALSDPSRRLNYRELNDAVDAAMVLFSAHGIKPQERIAGSLANCCDLVVAFLAAQRLGAIWVGINRVLSTPEKLHILGHAGVSLLILDTAGAEALGDALSGLPMLRTVLVIDDALRDGGWPAVFAGAPARQVARARIDPFAPAVIMYTSGTTGTPKGVVHSQHNMVTLCASAAAARIMYPDARRGVVLPLTITNVMILGPLIAFWNGRSCSCGQSTKIGAIMDWVRAEQIGTFAAVPTMVYDLLQGDYDLPDYLVVGAGGAPLPMPIRKAFRERYGYPLGGTYGLTEAPTVVTETRGIEPPAGSSGLALPHLKVTICDPEGAQVPTGEIGEVCISAAEEGDWAGVYTPALGYWMEPEKTAALLRGGVLHTGDMGRLDEGGWLYMADRSSELILRGGSNVYPGEIEIALYDHPGVAACAVIGRPDLRLGMRTVAFVQPAASHTDHEALREALVTVCKGSLARYKMPDEWVFVESFPRNAMGKIVKPALKDLLPPDGHDL
jgi:long-chain acyl-CoA synthetase